MPKKNKLKFWRKLDVTTLKNSVVEWDPKNAEKNST